MGDHGLFPVFQESEGEIMDICENRVNFGRRDFSIIICLRPYGPSVSFNSTSCK